MTRAELTEMGWESDEDESNYQRQFRGDMSIAGRGIRFYLGRHFYKGWATVAANFNDIQGVVRATSVALQWDQLGKDSYIVYPQ